VATTVGKMPQFDTAYKNAQYQLYHVYARGARKMYVGDTAPVGALLWFPGRVSDIAGREDVAREADVMQLAPAGQTTQLAAVAFDDGTAASYTVEGSTAKAKKAVAVRSAPARSKYGTSMRLRDHFIPGAPHA
jgi:hypothetical protein